LGSEIKESIVVCVYTTAKEGGLMDYSIPGASGVIECENDGGKVPFNQDALLVKGHL
jgi:hypothetical protein